MTTSNTQGSAADRLYKDAMRRAEAKVKAEQEEEHTLTSTFKPNLGDAFSHHDAKHRSDDKKSVSDRLYDDAVHKKKQDCKREGRAEEEEEKKEKNAHTSIEKHDHVHLKNGHCHPFASDSCPKAEYLRRMDTSLSVDGGSVERGIYEDSSVSSASTESTVMCVCGNIIQIELDMDEQVHPLEISAREDAKFSPDIRETQKAVSSPRNSRVHGKETKSVFNRLYQDTEQRKRKATMERNRAKVEEDKECTFRPKTNVKHSKMGAKKRRSNEKKSGSAKEKVLCQECLLKDQENEEMKQSSSPAEILQTELEIADDEENLLDAGETFAALSVQE